jgi:hypothetical protein
MSELDKAYAELLASGQSASMPSSQVKLLRKIAGKNALYMTEDNAIMVTRREYSKRQGLGVQNVKVTYTAVLRSKVGHGGGRLTDESETDIARGTTLQKVKEHIARYLSDRSQGTLGPRLRYDFSFDSRSVAR